MHNKLEKLSNSSSSYSGDTWFDCFWIKIAEPNFKSGLKKTCFG